MNILDENIIASQRQLLRSWRIRVRQLSHDIAQKGISDEQIISFSNGVAPRFSRVIWASLSVISVTDDTASFVWLSRNRRWRRLSVAC